MGRLKKSDIDIIKEEITIEAESPSSIESESEATASPIPKKEKLKTQKQICKVLYKTPTKFAISFNSDGILINDKSAHKTDSVEITYSGQYPESFEIVSYKFI